MKEEYGSFVKDFGNSFDAESLSSDLILSAHVISVWSLLVILLGDGEPRCFSRIFSMQCRLDMLKAMNLLRVTIKFLSVDHLF